MHSDAFRSSLSRRGFLGSIAAGAATLIAGRGAAAAAASDHGEGFRFVHLTDIHVQPELRAGEGLRQCLRTVHELTPRPDFILTGGDLVMDVLGASEGRARQLFDLYTGICRDSDIPIRQCIGNHDVFGWAASSKVSKQHAGYGKAMVRDRLGLERTTYSFDHKGWHFCVVDSIQPRREGGYEGGISDEDMDWLKRDLASAGHRPKIMCMHIPVLTVTIFRAVDATNKPNIELSKSRMCRNTAPILDMLRTNRVNLVLSGHNHQNERLQFDHTTHIEDGAVSGAWWRGSHHGNPEGFGIMDVRPDGTFEHRYQTYGWKAEPPPKTKS